MKIAIISDVIYPYVKGGVEKRVWELAVRLSRRGHDVHLYGMKFWEGNDIINREGIVLHGVCPATHLYSHGRRTIGEALIFGAALLPHLLRQRFDIIDCQQFPYFSAISSRIASLIRRTPLVITWIEVWGDYWYDYLGALGMFGKGIERIIASFHVPSIAISARTASRFRTVFRKDAPCVFLIGIDIPQILRVQPSPEHSNLLFIGRLIREKNADLVIRAFKLSIEDNPCLRLSIIGNGPEREALAALIRDLSLENRVVIHDFFERHDEVIARMKSSEVFVLPSTREGFGITALEALACGLPVVTVDHPANAIRDLITEKTGFICTLSAKDLADKIHSAIENHAEMKAACIASAQSFDWDCITADVEEYYRSIMEKQSTQK